MSKARIPSHVSIAPRGFTWQLKCTGNGLSESKGPLYLRDAHDQPFRFATRDAALSVVQQLAALLPSVQVEPALVRDTRPTA